MAAHAAAGALLAVPIGSCEQHGPHLPLGTDTDIAVALCERLAGARAEVLIAPPLAYGSSGEHAGFAGTLSIGAAATETVLLELGRSATDTFSRVLLVSAHGGNAAPVRAAAARLRQEGRNIALYEPRWSGDAHAGHTETSLQLALHPGRVGAERPAGNTAPIEALLPALRAGGLRAVTANGVLGDARGADADAGAELLATLTAALLAQVRAWAGPPAR